MEVIMENRLITDVIHRHKGTNTSTRTQTFEDGTVEIEIYSTHLRRSDDPYIPVFLRKQAD